MSNVHFLPCKQCGAQSDTPCKCNNRKFSLSLPPDITLDTDNTKSAKEELDGFRSILSPELKSVFDAIVNHKEKD